MGPEGVGKSHLAKAYGRECCMRGMSAYYIKARELSDKLAKAVKLGNEASVMAQLIRPACLIIDEIGALQVRHSSDARTRSTTSATSSMDARDESYPPPWARRAPAAGSARRTWSRQSRSARRTPRAPSRPGGWHASEARGSRRTGDELRSRSV